MGKNIKIELELPEFEKDLVISVTLHRDGEAITASSPRGVKTEVSRSSDSGEAWKQSADFWETKKTATPQATSPGNMMDMNF